MATMRATYFFKNTNGAGWTETLYTNATDPNVCLQQALNIMQFRRDLQGTGSRIAFVRVSDDEVKRDSLVFAVAAGDGATTKRAIDSGADIASTCALVRVQSGFIKRRSLFLRGIPDRICENNGVYTPTPEFLQAFELYQLAVKANGGCIKIRGDVAPVRNITNVSTSGPTGIVTITTEVAHGFTLNNVVNIREVLGATQVRGLQKVLTVPTPDTFTIRINRIVKPYFGGGIVVKNAFTLVGISAMQVVRCSHHNAGRPFDAPRGRRLVR